MSSRRRSRMGMFDHAKYSQPVLRNIPESVIKAVKDDVVALLNAKTAATRVIPGRKRHYGEDQLEREPKISLLPPLLMQCYRTPPAASVTREMDFTQHSIMEPYNNNANQLLDNSTPPQREKLKNKQPQCSNAVDATKIALSTKLSLKEFATKLLQSHPTTTLRTNEPMTLVDASFSLARHALLAAKERQKTQQNDDCYDADFDSVFGENSEVSQTPDKSPFRTLSDQTLFIQDELDGTYKDNSTRTNVFNRNASYLEESPMAEQEDLFTLQSHSSKAAPYSPLMTEFNTFHFDLSTNMASSSRSAPDDDVDFNSILNEFSDNNAPNFAMHYSRELIDNMNPTFADYMHNSDARSQRQYQQLITTTPAPVCGPYVTDTMEPFNFF